MFIFWIKIVTYQQLYYLIEKYACKVPIVPPLKLAKLKNYDKK